MHKGTLITLEGIDGSGKTTQAELLASWIHSQGIRYLKTQEPNGTILGNHLRKIVLQQEMMPLAEAFLFLSARAELYERLILPQLQLGKLVLVDRGPDSTVAYQGYGKQVGMVFIEQLNAQATKGREPNLTILLKINANTALHRKGNDIDRMERLELLARASDAYVALSVNNPKRIKVVQADAPVDIVHQHIVELVKELRGEEK
jgi:dTMP kinase